MFLTLFPCDNLKVPLDQPIVAFDMIRTFLSGASFSQKPQSLKGIEPGKTTTQCICPATVPIPSIPSHADKNGNLCPEPEPCESGEYFNVDDGWSQNHSSMVSIDTLKGVGYGLLAGVICTVIFVWVRNRNRNRLPIGNIDELDSLHLHEENQYTDKQVV